ncbi:flagellar biosynthesis anti-sigma factor FlgM [Porticoccus sp.]
MKSIENDMNIKPTQADLSQGSQKASSASAKSSIESAGDSSAASDTDSVKLTSSAMEFLKLEEILNQIPEIDSGRISALKELIAKGEYQIDTDKIVSNLLQAEKELY